MIQSTSSKVKSGTYEYELLLLSVDASSSNSEKQWLSERIITAAEPKRFIAFLN